MIKAILSALAVTTPVAETTYLDTGIYCSDTQSVVDSEGEEWGYDVELPDGTPVIITFDSKNTDSRYDDVITGLTEMDADDITNMIDMDRYIFIFLWLFVINLIEFISDRLRFRTFIPTFAGK